MFNNLIAFKFDMFRIYLKINSFTAGGDFCCLQNVGLDLFDTYSLKNIFFLKIPPWHRASKFMLKSYSR